MTEAISKDEVLQKKYRIKDFIYQTRHFTAVYIRTERLLERKATNEDKERYAVAMHKYTGQLNFNQNDTRRNSREAEVDFNGYTRMTSETSCHIPEVSNANNNNNSK